jgi:hypothetical protein
MTENSNAIKTAVHLNNQAVDHIMVDRNYEEAISLLENALHVPRNIMAQAEYHESYSHGPMNTTLEKCMKQSPQPYDSTSDGDSVFVYKRGIYVPTDVPLCFHSSVLLSVAITFNLALAHQLAASNSLSSTKRIRFLSKATKLYELAHNLHCCGELDSVSFTMACVNNLGVIHKDLSDHETAEKCFWHLLSTLMFIVDSRDSQEDDVLGINDNGLEGFLRNATERLIQQATAPAA